MTLFLSVCLFIVMLAQGAALRPADLSLRGVPAAVWQGLTLKLLAMPVIAWLCGWMFDLSDQARAGLLLLALAPASVGALALGGVLGADLSRLSRLIALSTLASLIWLPLVGMVFLEQGPGFTALIGTIALPLLLGLVLGGRMQTLAQPLAMLASILGGAMIVVALWQGWPAAEWAILQAAVLLALSVGVLGLYAARAMGQGGQGNASATALALLLAESAVPIGLAALIWGEAFGAYAVPAAIYAIAAYGAAILLVVRRVARRS